MRAIFQIIVFVVCAAALFGVGYFWGSSDTDKTLLKQITEVINNKSPIKLPIPTTTIISTDQNSVDLIKTLESLKGIDSWSLTQDHYFWGLDDKKWNPNLRNLRIEFKGGESYTFDNKTPNELMSLINVIKVQHE